MKPPALLADHHRLDGFDSGVASLDDWLRRRTRANQVGGASRTYVLCGEDGVVGYYALAAGAVAAATGRVRRNMPEPVPVVVLGRLAVDRRLQGCGVGRALFADAARRVVAASDAIGIRGLLVHVISDEARTFYERLGLTRSPLDLVTLTVTIADLRAAECD